MNPSVLLEAAITFEVVDRIVHCPMVEATVDGTPTKLILDTGATVHVLTTELANQAGLPSAPGEPGFDITGSPVPSLSLGEVSVEIQGCILRLRDVVAITGPPPFEGWGVGGFLSPQNLHPSALVVIDLVDDVLTLAAVGPNAAPGWLQSRFPALHLQSLSRQADETLAVLASVEPFDSVMTMLDTGSTGTEFASHAVPGLRGTSPGESGRGVSGAAVEGEEVEGQTVRMGDVRFPLPSLFVREDRPPPPGLLGMDVLRGTILAVTADETQPVHWLVPSSRRADGPAG